MSSDTPLLDFDDWDRDIFCMLGLPFDAESMQSAVDKIRLSVTAKRKVFLTTPNLNFVVGSLHDVALRQSVINSNMVVVDGMPLVLVARLLGLPIMERVAGASLFEQLSQPASSLAKLKVFFFGGMQGVAKRAHDTVNKFSLGMSSIGYLDPGFKSVEEMSIPAYITKINQAAPDFLVVALGAQKGQQWIDKNFQSLSVPVVSHLGAVINFSAGTVSRAPKFIQKLGLEWLWRIKEEPYLWRRYYKDGLHFLRLIAFNVLPIAIYNHFKYYSINNSSKGLMTLSLPETGGALLILSGNFHGSLADYNRQTMKNAFQKNMDVMIDFTHADFLGAGLIAYLLILQQKLKRQNRRLILLKLSAMHKRLLKWHCVNYLLD
ncbi:WecB/TagA/CpsF family glycosyltransferase [Methylophilus aquaticus]|uniref:WecB/TagA/CpsF family glycosyltransferase n=1 Tax=Methylophilus aquaticus TaxID=1971610 RepID=A0ABT9JT56_9PROT|nr:WecB/TagA/CpsF family glycosyltransferase [Methylophilus aquaticus]MDP8567766.1 WecB/TagA/CpsF family glycosyltransferase [Methylophilus aquaticus]